MSIPYNRTQMISTTLNLLGYPLIQSIASGGPAAAALDNLYDLVMAADLSSPNWRFASKTAQLSLVAGVDPDFDWFDSVYQLPPDCLAVWQIYPNVPFEVFGERLWTTGSQALSIQYRALVPESMLPPAYLMYFAYLLADSAGPPIVKDANMSQLIQAQMTKWRAQAMIVNTQGRPNQGLTNSPWVSARASGGSGYGAGRV
tara:strand:- start:818 stop:1420 length:603 start_codon:yes stop_codon:yes gene_type:complete